MATSFPECQSSRPFQGTAAHYLAGRPPYAEVLIRRVAELTGLGPVHAVLDLGCGPGVLARAFAPLAGSVVAMDPEPEMLQAAAENCAGCGNIKYVRGGSDDLSPALGQFGLAIMGRSFHWMDRADTLRRLDALIQPGGAVVHFHTDSAEVPANAWISQFRAVRQQYSGAGPDRPRTAGEKWVGHEAFLLASAFSCVESHSVYVEREFAADSLVDRAFSMSSSSRARLGVLAKDMERDIRTLIGEIAPDGRLTEVIVSIALIGRRPGEGKLP